MATDIAAFHFELFVIDCRNSQGALLQTARHIKQIASLTRG
jgi:hypothetical protein